MKSLFGVSSVYALVIAGVICAPSLFGWPFWKFPAILLGLLAMLIVILAIRGKIRFHRQGYRVSATSYPAVFEYRERHEGKTRFFKLPGELFENGHPVYHRLAEQEWEASVPDWAKDRQLEVEAKILENPFYRPVS